MLYEQLVYQITQKSIRGNYQSQNSKIKIIKVELTVTITIEQCLVDSILCCIRVSVS